MAVSSSSPAVAARCIHLRPNVGAAASQNITDPRLGTALLDLLEAGASAQTAIAELVLREPTQAYRQLAVVDSDGTTAAHAGAHTLGINNILHGDGVVAAGNMLAGTGVIDALLDGYLHSPDADLASRLLAGLEHAERAGGEAGPLHSAGLVALHPSAGWASTDLRVDWHDDPIEQLRALWQLWQPQRDDYIVRGLEPSRAPPYGVPGNR